MQENVRHLTAKLNFLYIISPNDGDVIFLQFCINGPRLYECKPD